jgi:alanyl-tRNA synthetase
VTERLYYTDALCFEFDATVTACRTVDDRVVVELDRTAFYPTSGGQPFDTGSLDGVAVVDVADLDDGGVGHVVAVPLEVGRTVRGRIDVGRRLDHMQQHTGQHILSAAFDALRHTRTVGFHLGALTSSLDLDKPLSIEDLRSAEQAANHVVWENRPVTIRFASPEEAAAMSLRKEPTRTGPLRIIDVAGYDRSACGGTHVTSTGQIGVIAITSWERLRGGVRLEFVCGDRALDVFRAKRDTLADCIRFLSVAPAELPDAIQRLQQDNKTLQRTIRGLQERLATHEAARLVAEAECVAETAVVIKGLDGWDQAGLKSLVSLAITNGRVVIALYSTADPRALVIGRTADVALDAGAILKHMTGQFGGKGGGKPDLAQGGGLAGSDAAMADALRAAIVDALNAGC